jgi:hypothetical protein
MRKILTLGLLLASAGGPVTAQNADDGFDYDQTAPLDEEENGTTKRGAVSILDLVLR